jgi:hypothetical protein
MRKFRQASPAQRLAISLIALYALLLQGFLATPSMAFAPAGDVICAPDQADSSPAGGEHKRHHGLCCIVACAACCATYVAAVTGLVVFPVREASSVGFGDSDPISALAPLEFYFAARAPPRIL